MQEWNPAAWLDSPCFAPLAPALEALGRDRSTWPSWAELNALVGSAQGEVANAQGMPIRFVPQREGKRAFWQHYEPGIFRWGEVPTRAGNWHDFFNALVWLTFPKSKAAINEAHVRAMWAARRRTTPQDSQRGRLRDALTLFDEGGVIVVSASAALSDLLRQFRWKDLFWDARAQVLTDMRFIVFGHGLY